MKVFIGYDAREPLAYTAATYSLNRHNPDIRATPLILERLEAAGLLSRPVDRRGQMYDLVSNAPASTDFSVSRFLTPVLAQEGWALFTDSDVIFMAPLTELEHYLDKSKAVMVVKHQHAGTEGVKMDGQQQTQYSRKNWSSVCLFQCDHPANRRLSLGDINSRPGRDLHAFYWLHDDEIGELPPEWNWLCGITPKPAEPKIMHMTLGGPFTPGWKGGEYDDLWWEHSGLRNAK